MRMKLLAGVAVAGLFAATAASAEPDGWYGAVDFGGHWADDVETSSDGAIGVDWDWEIGENWVAFARLGYRFNPSWRVEVEGGYRPGDIGRVRNSDGTDGPNSGLCNETPATGACFSPDGDIDARTLMANVIFDIGSFGSFRPFIGAGAGIASVEADTNGTLRQNRTALFAIDDSSEEFAWQGLAGFSWGLSDRLNLDVTYRYLQTDVDWESSALGAGGQLGFFDGEYTDHSLTAGLRWAFSAPAAPPPPPPPPPPPYVPPPPPSPAEAATRQFVVYFEWDRSDLTADAQAVVRSAAAYAKSGQPTRIMVVGHADTSGSQSYNQALSARRARTVSDSLVAQGVSGSVISMESRGETDPAKETGDGVREPLNRRATIDINFR